jgi:hypothetical protein
MDLLNEALYDHGVAERFLYSATDATWELTGDSGLCVQYGCIVRAWPRGGTFGDCALYVDYVDKNDDVGSHDSSETDYNEIENLRFNWQTGKPIVGDSEWITRVTKFVVSIHQPTHH